MNSRATAPAQLWTIGFRPFFALGCLAGLVAIAAWIWVWRTGAAQVGVFPWLWWHAHEMIYGFGAAVVVGFLATASANWSGLPPLAGAWLRALVALWLMGRIVMVLPGLPRVLVAAVDVAFLPAAGCLLLRHFRAREQRRNRMFLLLLVLWGAGSAAMHLGIGGWLPGIERAAAHWGVHLVIIMIAAIAGRVIPFFSSRAVAGYRGRHWVGLDVAVLLATLIFAAIAAALSENHGATRFAAAVAALLHTCRLALWSDVRILRLPILWVLYAGYAWIPIGLLLIATAPWLGSAGSTGLHALTAGAIGTMVVGMVSRVSLGHTGRPIIAGAPTVAAYVCVVSGTVVRVFGPFAAAHWPILSYELVVLVSGILWAAAHALLIAVYVPVWLGPRVNLAAAS